MSDKETLTVEVPIAIVWQVRHLNKSSTDFYTVEVSERVLEGETHLFFKLSNGGQVLREVMLSFDQIFNQARMVSDLLTEIRRDRNERAAE